MKIYFAGAIRGGRDDWTHYRDIVKLLREFGEIFTEHIATSELSALGEDLADREIHERDLAWLKASDCLVAEVTTPSLGVGYEIGKATGWGKPVLCLFRPNNRGALSAMIAGSDGVIVREYKSLSELTTIFTGFFSSGKFKC
jgi:2'-deoxynucleoside 5'-phosphate N-hydrolase